MDRALQNLSRTRSPRFPPRRLVHRQVEAHGKWRGKELVPMIALCGDALLEPFWPMGLGLKRGWQALMDTCFVVDNLCRGPRNRAFLLVEPSPSRLRCPNFSSDGRAQPSSYSSMTNILLLFL